VGTPPLPFPFPLLSSPLLVGVFGVSPGFWGLFLLFSLLPCSRLALDLSGAKAAFPAARRFFTRHILLHLIRYFILLALFKLFAFIYVFLHYDLSTIVFLSKGIVGRTYSNIIKLKELSLERTRQQDVFGMGTNLVLQPTT
jgi:hypothetical protein